MYGELLQSKFVYDEETKQVSEMTFSQISSTILEDRERKDADGRSYFCFDDFVQARIEHPELFEWIDEPENYVEQVMRDNNRKQ